MVRTVPLQNPNNFEPEISALQDDPDKIWHEEDTGAPRRNPSHFSRSSATCRWHKSEVTQGCEEAPLQCFLWRNANKGIRTQRSKNTEVTVNKKG